VQDRRHSATRPYALEAREGWTYDFEALGVDFVVKVGERRHGRRLAVFELTTRAGEEPPLHTHATEDEMFYVIEGDVAFRCGDERFEVSRGGFVFLPRGVEHSYEIRSGGDVRMLTITAPAPADGGTIGWDGFVASFERDSKLRSGPPWSRTKGDDAMDE
jgi:quercetin dioxygenase-like cupin family protein